MADDSLANQPSGPPSPGYLRLFLDDDPARAEAFFDKFPDAHWVQTAMECINELKEKTWDEIHLDHDLEGEWFVDSDRNDCGMEVVRWLTAEPRTHLMAAKFIVHSHNQNAAMGMVSQLGLAGYYVIEQPFGSAPAEPEGASLGIFNPAAANAPQAGASAKVQSLKETSARPSLLMKILRWFVPPPSVNQSWENAPARDLKMPRRGRQNDSTEEDGWGVGGGQSIDEPASDEDRPGPFVMPIREDDFESFTRGSRPGKPKPLND